MKRLELRARIIARYGTIGAFCKATGICPASASNILGGKTTPRGEKLKVWKDALGFADGEITAFLYPKS